MSERVSRRRFLAHSAAAGVTLAGHRAFADERPMPMRTLGQTKLSVSLVGLGGYQLGRGNNTDAQAAKIADRALDLGINYFDTAPSYGESERRLGLALKRGKKRDRVILATKTQRFDRDGARRELATSLKRLQTDRIDIWQFHALRAREQTEQILGKNGALAAARDALKAGHVRFVGITGHFDPAVFVHALKKFSFDTLLIPLNPIDPHHKSFEASALPFANKKNTGVIAMKVFCSGRLPGDKILSAEHCLRYTLGLAIDTCIVGCQSTKEVEFAAHVARNLKPLTDKERADLRAKTKAHSPALEWYKR